MSIKLKLSNILLNYTEYVKRRKSIGFTPTTYNTNNSRQLTMMFTELTDDIILYNDLINIFDYTQSEKQQIVNWLNKLNFKKVTWVHNIIEKNKEIFAEDNEESDMYLFESSNFDAFNYRKPGKFEVHYSDGIRRMTSFSNWQKALKYAVEKIESGKIKSLEIFKDESGFHSTTQEEYLELWWGKGSYWDNFNKKTGEVSDREYIQNLNESTFPISKSEF